MPEGSAQVLVEHYGISPADAVEVLAKAGAGEIWRNDRYTAISQQRADGSVAEISVRRNDRRPIRDWRDFQRIKNDIAGAECEAVELYPAMGRIMDTANQFYLWVLPPGERFPFGYDLAEPNLQDHHPGLGSVQRALPEDWPETDVTHREEEPS